MQRSSPCFCRSAGTKCRTAIRPGLPTMSPTKRSFIGRGGSCARDPARVGAHRADAEVMVAYRDLRHKLRFEHQCNALPAVARERRVVVAPPASDTPASLVHHD